MLQNQAQRYSNRWVVTKKEGGDRCVWVKWVKRVKCMVTDGNQTFGVENAIG